MRVGLVVASIAAALGFASMLVMAVFMVRSGRGLQSYRTVWLLEDNWVGFLVFIVALVIALVAGLALRRGERKQWRELERKYGGRDRHA